MRNRWRLVGSHQTSESGCHSKKRKKAERPYGTPCLRLEGLEDVLQGQEHHDQPHARVDADAGVPDERDRGDDEALADQVQRLPVPVLPLEPGHEEGEGVQLHVLVGLVQEPPHDVERHGDPDAVREQQDEARAAHAAVPRVRAADREVLRQEALRPVQSRGVADPGEVRLRAAVARDIVARRPRRRGRGVPLRHFVAAEVLLHALVELRALLDEAGVQEVQHDAQGHEEDLHKAPAFGEAPLARLLLLRGMQLGHGVRWHAAEAAVPPEDEHRDQNAGHGEEHVEVVDVVGVQERHGALHDFGGELNGGGVAGLLEVSTGDGDDSCVGLVEKAREVLEGMRKSGGGGGVGTRPRYSVVCLWRRLLASRHCSF